MFYLTSKRHHRSARGLRYLVVKGLAFACELPYAVGGAFDPPMFNSLSQRILGKQESPANALLDFPRFDETRSARPRRSIFAASRPGNLSPHDFWIAEIEKTFMVFQFLSERPTDA